MNKNTKSKDSKSNSLVFENLPKKLKKKFFGIDGVIDEMKGTFVHESKESVVDVAKILKETKTLQKYYDIDEELVDAEEIIEAVGRKRGFLKKGNQIDDSRVAIALIRDWQNGKLRL